MSPGLTPLSVARSLGILIHTHNFLSHPSPTQTHTVADSFLNVHRYPQTPVLCVSHSSAVFSLDRRQLDPQRYVPCEWHLCSSAAQARHLGLILDSSLCLIPASSQSVGTAHHQILPSASPVCPLPPFPQRSSWSEPPPQVPLTALRISSRVPPLTFFQFILCTARVHAPVPGHTHAHGAWDRSRPSRCTHCRSLRQSLGSTPATSQRICPTPVLVHCGPAPVVSSLQGLRFFTASSVLFL